MKRIFFLIFLLFSSVAFAQVIKIEIRAELKGNISALFFNASNGVLRINPEFFNSGSVAYKVRPRVDILNLTDIVFTGWGKEKILMPGERKNFEIYYYTQKKENLTARLRIYYGKELIEKKIRLKIENKLIPENNFHIKNFRTYDDYLRFEIRTNKSLANMIIIPKDYMQGWIFEQKKIKKIDENRNTEIILPYKAEVWTSHRITIEVVTEDGRYYTAKSFLLQKEKGIWKYIHYITDWLSLKLNL